MTTCKEMPRNLDSLQQRIETWNDKKKRPPDELPFCNRDMAWVVECAGRIRQLIAYAEEQRRDGKELSIEAVDPMLRSRVLGDCEMCGNDEIDDTQGWMGMLVPPIPGKAPRMNYFFDLYCAVFRLFEQLMPVDQLPEHVVHRGLPRSDQAKVAVPRH